MYEGLNILSSTALTHYPVSFPPFKIGIPSLEQNILS
jgi:hypothetical protein